MNQDHIRKQLVNLLDSSNAHATFNDAISGFPPKLRGVRPAGSPHSAWELLEHLRIAQDDIIEYARGTHYTPLQFPDDYWPPTAEPPNAEAWNKSVASLQADKVKLCEMIEDPSNDLFAPLPHARDATIYGQTLLLVDHNAYHVGQLMLLRRILE